MCDELLKTEKKTNYMILKTFHFFLLFFFQKSNPSLSDECTCLLIGVHLTLAADILISLAYFHRELPIDNFVHNIHMCQSYEYSYALIYTSTHRTLNYSQISFSCGACFFIYCCTSLTLKQVCHVSSESYSKLFLCVSH